jgi:predicted glutamine amidotransferase
MIAKVSKTESGIMEEMIKCPYSLHYLSQHGNILYGTNAKGEHRDGCGIALVNGSNIVIEKRDKEHCWDDSYIDFVSKAQSKIFIAHNRQTSKGLNSTVEGAHPFFISAHGVPYAFSHNGTVHDYIPEAQKRNTSDTLIFFEHLVKQDGDNTPGKILERLEHISKTTSYSSLTAFLMSPTYLIAWRIYNTSDKEKAVKHERYYTLYNKESNDNIVISSEPLDDDMWDSIPNNSALVITPTNSEIKIEEVTIE